MNPVMPDWTAIAALIAANGAPRPTGQPAPVGGGCIHSAWHWGPYFIKTNDASQEANFHAEATSLRVLGGVGSIRVPEVIGHGTDATGSFLVLEHLELVPGGDETRLGEQLAALHAATAPAYGFAEDNFLGATPQPNGWLDDWPAFFADRRLGHLLRLLAGRGVTFAEGDRLLSRLPGLLPRKPPAALLHGDLWSGNKAFLRDGTPVLFDPAAHHGHAECDLAMTTLFGGFGSGFYRAYHACRPLDDGHETRFGLYRLHHLLNHAWLFGGGYIDQARTQIDRLARA